jgi:hypothetical protein
MRDLKEFEKYAIETGPNGSAYRVSVMGVTLAVIASNGGGWDHISVSADDRCPTWEEMELVARMFLRPDEVAMQLHLPAADHINIHPFTLHWWRPQRKLRRIPLPPKMFV